MAERGQATVELVAALPALLLAALVALQLLAAGYALTLADGAAEAGALALASGGSAAEAAREALPGLGGGRRLGLGRGWRGLGPLAATLAVRGGREATDGDQQRRGEAGPVTVFVNPLTARGTALVTAVGDAEGSRGAAAALACAGADADLATLLVDVGGRSPRPTLIASAAARQVGRAAAGSPARGEGRCPRAGLPPRGPGRARGSRACRPRRRRWRASPARCFHLPPEPAARGSWPSRAGVRRGSCCGPILPSDRALVALVVRDLIGRDLRGGRPQAPARLGCRASGAFRGATGRGSGWAARAAGAAACRGQGIEGARRVGAGAGPRPRRGAGADRRGAGAGRDRRRRHRQGQGAAGGRSGRDLGGSLDARRPAALAGAASAG